MLVLGVSSHLATRSDKPHQEVYLVHGDPGMVSDTFQKTQTAPHTTSGVLLESGGLIRAAIVHKRNKAAFSKLWVFALTSHTPLLTLPFLPSVPCVANVPSFCHVNPGTCDFCP
jgi:hypothetical protein